jgi:hypothetical protein
MFGIDGRLRLQRFFDANLSVSDLAQEIYCMLDALAANTTQAPVRVNLPAGSTVAPYNIDGYEDGNPLMRMFRGGVLVGDISISGGNLVFTPTGATPSSTSSSAPATASSFPGKVISGSGSTYTVAIYEAGPAGGSRNVSVTQLQISSSETIPANTWAIVTKNGSAYSMQVAVWQ